jgi:hypothetical protein
MRMLTVALVVLTLSGSASAQQLTLQFANGRVTLDAAEVPVRTILAEWARQGGTRVVNGDRVTGSPLTIRLENVPEAQALEIILRNVAGYMAAPRLAGATGASTYDRILVMPTSTTVAAAPSGPAGRNAQGGAGNRPGRQTFPPPQPVDEAPVPSQEDMTDANVNQPFEFPQQQNPFQAIGQPGPFGTPIAPGGQAPNIQFGAATGTESGVVVNSAPAQPMPVLQFPGAPPAGGGFGTMAAPMPGTVVQPPAQPGQRPPGDR